MALKEKYIFPLDLDASDSRYGDTGVCINMYTSVTRSKNNLTNDIKDVNGNVINKYSEATAGRSDLMSTPLSILPFLSISNR
jgi:hypothetical protein